MKSHSISYYALLLLILVIGISGIRHFSRDSFVNITAPYGTQGQWWKGEDWKQFASPAFSYWKKENFENAKPGPDSENAKPGPDSADIYNNEPYHLLERSPPRDKESLSCINSRSCYAVDFDRMISKTGTFRQLTNNYKRDYPDSCSSPFQDLVGNFYKADMMPIPAQNTGGSVSYL